MIDFASHSAPDQGPREVAPKWRREFVFGSWIAVLCLVFPAAPLFGQTNPWSSGSGGTIYYNGGNVGVGTAAPSQRLSVFGSSGGAPGIGSSNAGLAWIGEGPGGNAINIGYYYVPGQTPYGWIQSQFVGNVAAYYPLALNPLGGNVGIGTTNPGSYKLAVEGKIGAREVVVTSAAWADYIFRPGYRLLPLSEVKAYIQSHRHLPDIPSEADVKAQGVSVGEMQAKLLAKIEELTLHMIQADERDARLERQNQELRDEIREMKARMAR